MRSKEEILATVLITSAMEAIEANRVKYYLATDFIDVIAYHCPKGKTSLYFCTCANCVHTINKLNDEIRAQHQIGYSIPELHPANETSI